jgi:Cu(I)/Ag(I) efflux system membrane fusion protein
MNRTINRSGWTTLVLVIVLIVAIIGIGGAFGLGYWLGRARGGGEAVHEHEESVTETGDEDVVWTCSMHPQIRMPEPGQCPLCFMDLIPVSPEEGSGDIGPRELKMSERARQLAEVEVAPADRKFVTAEVRLVGKIQYDETKLGYITAWVPGRLDRLYVDYTGISVRKGDHMVYMYSPSLLTDQRSLLQAQEDEKDIYRERLRLKGLTDEQIQEIENRGTPSDHVTIYAPMGGIVVHKNAVEGMYVNTGTRIYTIADLSRVWVLLDTYETDLPWIRYGQEVDFETEAYPGETFTGRISFIDPILNDKTRTVKVRVNVDNSEGKLKPEMFVRAVVRSKVAAGGKVMEPELAGKWISPMHPEIVKDEPGVCDVCGMPLVRAESLGYVAVDAGKEEAPLVIPDSAPLITGKRAVVYVSVPDKEGVFEGREIVLGPRAGQHYIVKEGLEEGEMVVVHGNFKIDSEIQIQAKPSMMSPEGGAPVPGHDHGGSATKHQRSDAAESETKALSLPEEFKNQLESVYGDYFDVQQGLSGDDLNKAKNAAGKLIRSLEEVDASLLDQPTHKAWMNELNQIRESAKGIETAANMVKAREQFSLLSGSLTAVARRFGASRKQPVLRFHCPMAFDNQGAYWLQNKTGVENPYFGSVMFRCGKQVETIAAETHEGSTAK